jgi:hypothetical protein
VRPGIVACASLAGLAWARPRARRLLALTLPALLIAEAAWWHAEWNPAQPAAAFPGETELHPLLRERVGIDRPGGPRLARFHRRPSLPPLPSNLGLVAGLRDLHGYEGLVDARTARLLEAVEPGSFRHDHLLRPFREPASLLHPLLDVLSVRWVLSTEPLVEGLEGNGVWLLERPDAAPRLTVPARLRVVASPVELWERLKDPARDARNESLLLPAEARALLGREVVPGEILAQDGARAEARILTESATRLHLRVRVSGATVLRLADAWRPGWRAFDGAGAALPLVRCDGALRAVAVPGGRHDVTLEYAPRSWRWGLRIGGAGVAGLLAILAMAVRARRRAVAAAKG